MTGHCGTESEQLVASAEGAEKAISTPERGRRGCRPPRRLELSASTGESRGINTATDLDKAVKFAPVSRDNDMKDFPGPTSNRPLVDTSRITSAARRGAWIISGFQTVPDEYTAIESGELGLRI